MVNFIVYGAIAGVVASILFVIIHYLLISPIWFILPFASIFGALTGSSLAWSYMVIFNEFNLLNSVKLFGIFIIPVILLEISSFFLLERQYTMEESMDPATTGALLTLAFMIVIPFGLIYGVIQGIVLGGTRELIFSSVATNFIIFTGIGHNLPIFNAVEVDDDWLIWRTKMLAWSLLLILYLSYAVSLHNMETFTGRNL